MACSVSEVTCTVAVAVWVPTVAVIVTSGPAEATVSRPAASTEAMAGLEELQVAAAVTSRVLGILNVPSTVSCCVVLTGNEIAEGLIEIPVRLGVITFKVLVPEALPRAAVMVD